jgi:hypothetical protein
MTDKEEGLTPEGLTLSLGEGISAHALVKSLASVLQEKGILTDADINTIEDRAGVMFEADLKVIGETGS